MRMVWDRLSALPDCLITKILLYLPTKDTVKTSLLSTRWRYLWHHVPGLEFHSNDFSYSSKAPINTFIGRFLEFDRELRLQKFKVAFERYSFILPHSLTEWIAIAVDRGIEDLNVTSKSPNGMFVPAFMPFNLYNSKTLVSLKFANAFVNPVSGVSLPCLKIMHLEDIRCFNNYHLTIEKIILGCPVLEDLTIVRSCYKYETLPLLRVSSHSLKILRLKFDWEKVTSDFSVEIYAPGLKYLSFKNSQHARVVVRDMTSLFKIDIDTELNPLSWKKENIHDFLSGISSVKHMIISQPTLQAFYQGCTLGPILNFSNLSHLKAAFSSSLSKFLPIFLASCPNLKNLMLDFHASPEPEEVDLTYMPWCLSSSLAYVEINKLTMWEENGIKLVRYILENSAVLKKLKLSFTNSSEALDIYDYEERIKSIKRSRRCQLEFSY